MVAGHLCMWSYAYSENEAQKDTYQPMAVLSIMRGFSECFQLNPVGFW